MIATRQPKNDTQTTPHTTRGYRRYQRHREAVRQQLRADNDSILRRATALDPQDRELLDHHLARGIPLESLARLHGKTPSSLRRRIVYLKRRLMDPTFLAASRCSAALPEPLRATVRAYYIERRSMRECADRLHMTIHAVRQTLTTARAMLLLASVPEND